MRLKRAFFHLDHIGIISPDRFPCGKAKAYIAASDPYSSIRTFRDTDNLTVVRFGVHDLFRNVPYDAEQSVVCPYPDVSGPVLEYVTDIIIAVLQYSRAFPCPQIGAEQSFVSCAYP